MIKKAILLVAMLSLLHSYSQVGIGTTTPDASSMLEIQSTTSGLLIPRMTEAQRLAIGTPATGLLVYETDTTPGFWYYDGGSWATFGADVDWTVSGTDMYNANTGNVGIGNTAPSALLHLTGTTVPSSGGTSTLYTNDFSSGGITNILNGGNGCTVSPNIWHISATSSNASCTTCTGNRVYINYSSSCVQDQTFVEGNFTPTTTSVDISFNYGYDDFSGATDSFIVTLYNETTSSVTATLLNLTTDALNSTYSSTETVTIGDNYSIRFQYTGDNDWGAAVDDILVTESSAPTAGTYMFRLEDGQEQAGYVLTSDANGYATWQVAGAGGTDDQTISLAGTTLSIESGNSVDLSSIGSGDDDWRFQSGSTESDDIYRTGNVTIGSTWSTTHELDVDNGSTDGTEIGFGSIEFIRDGVVETFFDQPLLPLSDAVYDLGTASFRWNEIFASNGVINTSDARLKTAIKPLNYGLNEIMLLKPVSYKWKNEQHGKTIVPDNEKEVKIGFLAQDLQQVIGEVVTSHSWKPISEEQKDVYIKKENERLGVNYSEIIPVTVKAIQEQQEQIEALKTSVEELKKQNKLLMKLLEKK